MKKKAHYTLQDLKTLLRQIESNIRVINRKTGMSTYVNKIILDKKSVPAYVDNSTVMHAGVRRHIW